MGNDTTSNWNTIDDLSDQLQNSGRLGIRIKMAVPEKAYDPREAGFHAAIWKHLSVSIDWYACAGCWKEEIPLIRAPPREEKATAAERKILLKFRRRALSEGNGGENGWFLPPHINSKRIVVLHWTLKNLTHLRSEGRVEGKGSNLKEVKWARSEQV